MIPKKIHYCWFGGNPLPQDALMCIESWKKYFPDYEIIEWNEKNFDMNSCDYIREAAENKKWAFVSDFARFKMVTPLYTVDIVWLVHRRQLETFILVSLSAKFFLLGKTIIRGRYGI